MPSWVSGQRPSTLAHGEVQVWRLSITEDGVDRTVLSDDERLRADRFVFEKDALQFAATRAALRHLLARYLGADPAAIAFTTEEHGKPILAGRARVLHFNVSHSSELALLAFCLDREVGADVQWHRPQTDVDGLAPTVCTAREHTALKRLAADDRRRAFFHLWAGKEAILKALGSGLAVSPRRIELLPFLRRTPCDVRLAEGPATAWHAQPIEVGTQFSAAVASAGPPTTLRLFDVPAGAFSRWP